jgi:hypothetical protein
MFYLLFFYLGLLLSFHSLRTLASKQVSFLHKLAYALLLISYAILSCLLLVSLRLQLFSPFIQAPWQAILFSLLSAGILLYLLKKRPTPVSVSYCVHSLGLPALTLAVSLSCIQSSFHSQPIVKVWIPGSSSSETVEWKNPYAKLQKTSLTTYEVQVQKIDSKMKQTGGYFFGDLIGIRIRVIYLHPILHFLGIQNPYDVDCLFSDYLSSEKKRNFPSKSLDVQMFSNVPNFLYKASWALWETLFYQKLRLFFVQSAGIETQYFPLVDAKGAPFKGSYLIMQSLHGMIPYPLKEDLPSSLPKKR